MIYWRCKCGKAELWESGMTPSDCQGCNDCATTYATSPSGHRKLTEHVWVERFDPATGKFAFHMCAHCFARKPQENVDGAVRDDH